MDTNSNLCYIRWPYQNENIRVGLVYGNIWVGFAS